MTTNKRLLVYGTDEIEDFNLALAHAFHELGGEATVLNCRALLDGRLPEHDIIHPRFGVAYTSPLYTTLKDHVESHGCLSVNKPVTMAWTANKMKGNEIASEVMKTPKTIHFNYKEVTLESAMRQLKFPMVLKPQWSCGGKHIYFYKDETTFRNYVQDEQVDARFDVRNWLLQEAVDFKKLVRVVYMDEKIQDAVYDDATDQFKIRLRLGRMSKVWTGDRSALAETSAKLAQRFQMSVLVVDYFVMEDGELVFNEINSACNLRWLRLHSHVPHATRLAEFLRGYHE